MQKRPEDWTINNREVCDPLAGFRGLDVRSALNRKLSQSMQIQRFPIETFRMAGW